MPSLVDILHPYLCNHTLYASISLDRLIRIFLLIMSRIMQNSVPASAPKATETLSGNAKGSCASSSLQLLRTKGSCDLKVSLPLKKEERFLSPVAITRKARHIKEGESGSEIQKPGSVSPCVFRWIVVSLQVYTEQAGDC